MLTLLIAEFPIWLSAPFGLAVLLFPDGHLPSPACWWASTPDWCCLLATEVFRFCTPVAVAAVTLASAALFNPVRRRVQRTVGRRFNRARYDADKTVAAFAARLKDAVELDAVRDDLTDVVGCAKNKM